MYSGGNELRLMRAKRQMTGKELAKKAGIGQNTVSRIENGYHKPQAVVQGKLANALGISVREVAAIFERAK